MVARTDRARALKTLDEMDAEERALRAAAKKRYERKKVLLFAATIAAPLILRWLGLWELGPYVFAFMLIITFAHIVDHEIDSAVDRAKTP